MVQDGDTITYPFNPGNINFDSGTLGPQTEDISNIDTIVVNKLDGDSSTHIEPLPENDFLQDVGRGGYIENAEADVSGYDNIYIYPAGEYDEGVHIGPEGLSNRTADRVIGEITTRTLPGPDGTEITGPFCKMGASGLATGGSAGATSKITVGSDPQSADLVAIVGGGGAGGVLSKSSNGYCLYGAHVDGSVWGIDGVAAQGDLGGSAGLYDSNTETLTPPGGGSQELGIASGGTLTTGGSSDGNGEIKITYKASSTTSETPPKAPSSLTVEVSE